MHHPGPPRFTSVGESVELAPRAPDPDAHYEWALANQPEGSDLALGGDPVESLAADVPGIYRARLDAPDGTHAQTVRAFPDERRPVRFEVDTDDLAGADDVWISAPFNEHRLGVDRAVRDGDRLVFETHLPPGRYEAMFVPDGNYRAAERVTEVVHGPRRPRITLDATVVDGEVVFEATPLPAPTGEETPDDLKVEFYIDDRHDIVDLTVDGTTARCPLSVVGTAVQVYAVAVGPRYSVADAVRVEADGTVDRHNRTPEWVRDATLYSIFTRSFTGEVDASFREVERRVPYLSWLGVDALWATPIVHALSPERDHDGFERGGPHGYDTLDYFRTAPDLGTVAEFESLVETCHDHGIRVVFDLVINHTSRHHRAFHLASAGVDEYREWYTVEDGEYDHYFNWRSLPNLQYDSPAVRAHLLDVVDFWAERVDGFRCDVAWGVPHGFWMEVRDRVREHDAEFLMLDESIPRDPQASEGAFDLHYDTTLYETLLDVGRGAVPADKVLTAVQNEISEGFPPHATQMRYIENHDEDRYLEACGRDAQTAAGAATFTLPGVPMLYYGQETGMDSYRAAMDWGGDEELTAFYRRLSRRRDDLDVLRRGSVQRVEYDADTDRVVAFARETDDRRVVVVLHFGTGEATVTLPDGVGRTDLLTEIRLDVDAEYNGVTVDVDSVVVFEW